MPIHFNGTVLQKVASAIVNDQKITTREAKSIAKVAIENVKNSASPKYDAVEVKNAVKVAIQYAARDTKSASATKVLSQLEAQIDAARIEREKELAPKFSLAENKKAATGATITYDYEFLAGGAGEDAEVQEFLAYVNKLVETVPSLKKWKGIEIDAYGPSL